MKLNTEGTLYFTDFKPRLKVSFFKVIVFGYFVWKQNCDDNVEWTYFTHWQMFPLVSLFTGDLVQLLCSFSSLLVFAFFFLLEERTPSVTQVDLAGFKLTAIFLSLIEVITGICIILFCVSVQISKAAFFSSNQLSFNTQIQQPKRLLILFLGPLKKGKQRSEWLRCHIQMAQNQWTETTSHGWQKRLSPLEDLKPTRTGWRRCHRYTPESLKVTYGSL